jgi:hypothetical protein
MQCKLSDQIQHAHTHAARAADQAKKAAKSEDQREWLALERSWLKLVESYEVSERFDNYLAAFDPKKK